MNNKYRVWCEQLGRMISGDDLKLDQAHGSLNDFFNDPDYVFMRYTGLDDGSASGIYEGDILSDNPHYHAQVVWSVSECRFGIVEHGCTVVFWMPYSALIGKFKVVGNIYENPELLPENTQVTPNQLNTNERPKRDKM